MLEAFLRELAATGGDEALLDFCRRCNLHGTPAVFAGDESRYYQFRKRIAQKFDIRQG